MKANVTSVMCSYNKFNESWACERGGILNCLLKDELDFQGFVVSGMCANVVPSEFLLRKYNRLGCATHHYWKCKWGNGKITSQIPRVGKYC